MYKLNDKTIFKAALIGMVLLLIVPFFMTRVWGNETQKEYEEDEPLSFDREKAVLKPGKSLRLSIQGTEGKEIIKTEWVSGNDEVVTVNKKGKVTAVSEGTAYVVARIRYKNTTTGLEKKVKLRCKIKVEAEKIVKLAAVGDALIHENILKSGKQKDGSYNYDLLFKHVKDYLEDFDVKIINQETIFVYDSDKFAGYPSFGTPKEVGDAMRKAGFNVITCATNHAYDKGSTGIKNTVDYWKNYKDSVLMTGIYTSQKDYDTIAIRDYNGIKIAFLNYTTLLNSGAKREPYNIRYYKESEAIKEIKQAKKKADIVIVLPHWGIEYEHEPSEEQERMAKKFAEAGADAIIGCHPHVVQPMKVIKTSDGRRVPCYYSLGNFVSNMFWFKCQLEGMAELTIVKWNGKASISAAEYTPLVNHINDDDSKFTVYLLEDYKGEKYKDHYMNNHYWMGLVTYSKLKDLFKSMGNEKF